MFYDAMQIALPGFTQSGAKLVLNILDCLPANNQVSIYILDAVFPVRILFSI
ncbi:unnamed protein product [Schistosoma margrebowiei]|uniref:Uncharacterized protein n=1 Tax=Schistosoma margrebowiei TaxID=48269 RepID=A0A183M1X3_9TREM|nr:unnamed protein product [Schistosoma margrebowiei]